MAIWTIDKAHTEIGFKIKHLVISTVSGKFTSFGGKLEGNPEDFKNAKISFTADADSIHTGNEQRDGHLKSADFFDSAQYPKIVFNSVKIEQTDENLYRVTGDLTIKNVTKQIALNVEFGGLQNNFYGQTVAGFEITGKINRQDFGLTWSAVTEAGGIVVSDEVRLAINVELVKEQVAAAVVA